MTYKYSLVNICRNVECYGRYFAKIVYKLKPLKTYTKKFVTR